MLQLSEGFNLDMRNRLLNIVHAIACARIHTHIHTHIHTQTEQFSAFTRSHAQTSI